MNKRRTDGPTAGVHRNGKLGNGGAKMRKRNKLTALLLAFAFVLTLGGPVLASDLGLEVILQGEAPPRSGEGFVVPDAGAASGGTRGSSFSGGSGSVTYAAGVGGLASAQEQLLTDFMNTYYSSLARLQAQDLSWLFAAEAGDNAQFNQAVMETLIGIRAMQPTDLSLTGYSFSLNVRRMYTEAGGVTVLHVFEENALNFPAYPGVTSRGYEIAHVFRMVNAGGQWKLTQHYQSDSLTDVLFGRTLAGGALSSRQESVLSDARYYTNNRSNRGGSPGSVSVDHSYNRSAAVSYAREWVGKRNGNWRNYTNYGGNCQNFVSQALLAGGIPMDTSSPGIWKWYGDSVSNGAGAAGRSSSWSGVAAFLTYVRTNQGYGLVAYADYNYYAGEVGDVIHIGASNGYAHTVMITEVVRDRNGNVIDYLVSSNTADLRDFPVSAYYYTNQMLIKIYGWNDAPRAAAE